ncbi:hypothetical protein C2G38_2241863 [Gigaspora rosea]|uniref:Uncharacterized protein n=1 Tax=Gigaspora rosea TaxID=44941 RepID=A0A397VQA0_9GLOM|nr:hypothetical protein C2G38_2241863 [Gigaspora rosea]
MLKTRIIATLIALFAFLITYLHATPVRRDDSQSAVAVLKKLDGKVTIEQFDESTLLVKGKFNKGINDKNPDHYFVQFDGSIYAFSDLNITTSPPGTDSWSTTIYTGKVSDTIDQFFTVKKNNKVIDQATIVKD